MVVSVDRDPRYANGGQQGRLHTNCQKEGARHVPLVGVGQADIPVRRAAEEVPAGAVRAADGRLPLT